MATKRKTPADEGGANDERADGGPDPGTGSASGAPKSQSPHDGSTGGAPPPVGESPTGQPPAPPSERELIVIVAPSAGLRVTGAEIISVNDTNVSTLASILADEQARLEPLFGLSEDILRTHAMMLSERAAAPVPDLSVYYRVRADDERLDALSSRLMEDPLVEGAYVKPGAEPAGAPTIDDPAVLQAAPPATADFTGRQGYLSAPPEGVNAQWAAGQAGGDGVGGRIVDVEGAWQLDHEDLLQNNGGVIAGVASDDISWRNHGTAVFGEFGGDDNNLGVLGIAPGAQCSGASIFGGVGSAAAVRQAADHLNAGDVLLIELHRPGPRFNFEGRADQLGYIAMEWFPDDLDAIRYAVARGVIVVEAAGNGAENLDDALYDQPAPGFPAGWLNPFNINNPSSGAVIVGAGAPPPGTHGRDHGPDRSRLDFSNHGQRVDAQGWGREVTTTGYGDLQGGQAETLWYTDRFSGTSSASPIVVGSLSSIQGILRQRGLALLNPQQAIDVLRATGSPQQDAPGRPASQRIGNRPDIRAAVEHIAGTPTQSGTATQYWDEAVPYPPRAFPRLWLYAADAWRALDNPDTITCDLVQRAFLGTAQTVQVWFQGETVVGLVITGS